MAKGAYEGVVVGGASWEIIKEDKSKLSGFSYKVLLQDDYSEQTKLFENVSIVSVGTANKEFDPKIIEGTKVSFKGAEGKDFKTHVVKIKYSNLQPIETISKKGGEVK